MADPAICELTGTVFSGRDTDDLASLPAPFPRKLLEVTPLSITGSLLSTKKFTVPSASDGTFAFGLYQGAAYNIKGEVAGYNGHNGTNVTIPVAASATLEGLTSVTTYPVTGATVQNEGVALPSLIGTFNFAGVGVDVTQSSGGVALVTIPGSSFVNQNANLVFAGPASGVAAAPAFRSLVALDIPDLSAAYSPVAHTHTFASLTSTPTTLAGYGITDAVPSSRQVNGHPLSADVTVTPTDLGLVIGTNVQAFDADLSAIAALAGTSGLLQKTAANTWSLDTTVYASQAYADSLVVGLLDDRGNYDASVNTFPASGGSGGAGAILKGDLWTISVGGTLGGTPVTAGDLVRAIVDTPGQTVGNWAVSETNIGYTPLNAALANGALYIGNGSGVGAAVTPSGDVTIDNLGVTAIGLLKVTNGMLAGAIALSKLSITGTPDGTKYLRDDGTWQTVSGGATVALDNLSSVDINTSLLFQATAGVGSAAKPALNAFIGSTVQYESIVQTAGLITHALLGSATDVGFVFTPKGAGVVSIGGSQTIKALGSGGTFTLDANGGNYVLGNVGGGGTFKVKAASLDLISTSGSTGDTTLYAQLHLGNAADNGLARNAAAQVQINNGAAGQWGSLFVGTRDAGTTTVTNGLTLGHQSTGTPAAGLGSGILFNINSSTTADQNAAQIAALWTVATHATRTADLVFYTVNSAAALAEAGRFIGSGGLRLPDISGGSGTYALGTLAAGVLSIGRSAGGANINIVNSQSGTMSTISQFNTGQTMPDRTVGMQLASGATSPNMQIKATTGGQIFLDSTGTLTNVVLAVATVGLHTTGTPAAGYGPALGFNGKSSTTADQNMAQISAVWTDAAHATRTSKLSVGLVNSAAALAEVFKLNADSRAFIGTPNSAPTDADISNNFISAYLDEAGALLKFRVRQSDGSYKTGQVAIA